MSLLSHAMEAAPYSTEGSGGPLVKPESGPKKNARFFRLVLMQNSASEDELVPLEESTCGRRRKSPLRYPLYYSTLGLQDYPPLGPEPFCSHFPQQLGTKPLPVPTSTPTSSSDRSGNFTPSPGNLGVPKTVTSKHCWRLAPSECGKLATS